MHSPTFSQPFVPEGRRIRFIATRLAWGRAAVPPWSAPVVVYGNDLRGGVARLSGAKFASLVLPVSTYPVDLVLESKFSKHRREESHVGERGRQMAGRAW